MKKFVAVSFLNKGGKSDKTYDFFTDIDDLEVGDIVVCDTSNGLAIACVEELLTESDKAAAWIISKVPQADIEKNETRKLLLELDEKTEEKNKARISRLKSLKTFKLLFG